MTTMSEYAALHGWEVGAQLRYKDSATPSTITARPDHRLAAGFPDRPPRGAATAGRHR